MGLRSGDVGFSLQNYVSSNKSKSWLRKTLWNDQLKKKKLFLLKIVNLLMIVLFIEVKV